METDENKGGTTANENVMEESASASEHSNESFIDVETEERILNAISAAGGIPTQSLSLEKSLAEHGLGSIQVGSSFG